MRGADSDCNSALNSITYDDRKFELCWKEKKLCFECTQFRYKKYVLVFVMGSERLELSGDENCDMEVRRSTVNQMIVECLWY